jgi:hypothetical protein
MRGRKERKRPKRIKMTNIYRDISLLNNCHKMHFMIMEKQTQNIRENTLWDTESRSQRVSSCVNCVFTMMQLEKKKGKNSHYKCFWPT